MTVRKSEFYREARSDLRGPLHGLRAVEATTTWAGPMCGCILADFGAEVIKVEHPRGEVARHVPPPLPGSDPPLSALQASVNRNKRSLSLDLSKPEGADLFRRLVASADVVIENFRPGTLERWGVGWKALRAMRHDLVMVSISGFGQWGPESDRAGYDPMAQAESGFLSLNGEPEGGPLKSPTFLGDDLAGLHAALAVLAALRHRDATGEGQWIDVALLDAMLFQTPGYLTLAALGAELPRLGNQFRVAAPANVYRCADGGLVMAGVLVDAHWRALARVLGRPELADDPGYATAPARIARRDAVDGLVAAWMAERSQQDALDAIRAVGLPAAPVRSYAEAARSAHTREREMLQQVATEGSEIPVAGPPAKFSRTPTRVRHGAPALGAETDAILDELGIDAETRARLRRDAIVG